MTTLAPKSRWTRLFVATFAILVGPATLLAQRVAVVDMALVYKSYPEVIKTTYYLKEKKDQYQQEVDKERRKIEDLVEEIKQKRGKVPDTQIREMENSRRRMLFDLQNRFQGFKEKLQDLEQEEFERIREAVKSALSRLARRKGHALVIEKQWVYHGESEDLTNPLITSLGGEIPGTKKEEKR